MPATQNAGEKKPPRQQLINALGWQIETKVIMHNIQIDNEFKSLIPPLSAEERAQLEANIVADGCRDPLVLWAMPTHTVDYSEEQDGSDVETFFWNEAEIVPSWDEKNGDESYRQWRDEDGDLLELFEDEWPCILIDGHNRYEICTRLELPFETVFKDFAGRDDAIEWIINNQFGRRNLSDYQRGVLALRMKPIFEARALANMAARKGEQAGASSPKSDELTPDIFTGEVQPVAPVKAPAPIRTDTAVASLANLGKDTIRKIEQIEEVAAPEVKALAAAGDVSINLASQFVSLPEEVQQEAIAAIAEQNEPAKEVMREAVKKAHVANNSGNNEWYTPGKYIELARQVMGGIDTDPATSEIANRTVKAEKIFTAEDDGRNQVWSGRVWMNPPYAQPLMGDFAEAVSSKFESGEIDQATILVNNGTETQWFQRILGVATAVCFPKTRIKFVDPSGNPSGAPLQGQAILYLGKNVDAFAQAFSVEGVVLRHA